MLIKGRPIPDELKPLDIGLYNSFLEEIFTEKAKLDLLQYIQKVQADWNVFSVNDRLRILENCYEILFLNFIPKPTYKLTFSRVRFTATFHYDDWSIRFSQNYFERNFSAILKTWFHETYHGLLHFLSLRINMSSATTVINPPKDILMIAKKYPLSPDNKAACMFAERNLIGMIDRHLTHTERYWAGLDSYYLNVEIIVENLTIMSMKKIFPNMNFQRNYNTAEEYINLRMQGHPPLKASGG